MVQLANVRDSCRKDVDTVVAPVASFLSERRIEANRLKVIKVSDNVYSVYRDRVARATFEVNLDKKTCSCLLPNQTGLVCEHQFAAAKTKGGLLDDMAEFYKMFFVIRATCRRRSRKARKAWSCTCRRAEASKTSFLRRTTPS